jgi:hypothetical protein
METHFGLFGDSVNQHARQVHGCAKRAIGLEILLANPKELLGDVGQIEACFSFIGDSANLDTR